MLLGKRVETSKLISDEISDEFNKVTIQKPLAKTPNMWTCRLGLGNKTTSTGIPPVRQAEKNLDKKSKGTLKNSGCKFSVSARHQTGGNFPPIFGISPAKMS